MLTGKEAFLHFRQETEKEKNNIKFLAFIKPTFGNSITNFTLTNDIPVDKSVPSYDFKNN
jgi:hypothetical protein